MKKVQVKIIEEFKDTLVFNYTEYALKAVLWNKLYGGRKIPSEYIEILYREKACDEDGKILEQGKILAKQHHQDFLNLYTEWKKDENQKEISPEN